MERERGAEGGEWGEGGGGGGGYVPVFPFIDI